jgi:hypothetical protein
MFQGFIPQLLDKALVAKLQEDLLIQLALVRPVVVDHLVVDHLVVDHLVVDHLVVDHLVEVDTNGYTTYC